VIAIIAVLIGLLLPAVQKVREAAARSTCQNNLKQIALAAHNYASANGVLPPGYVGNPPSFANGTGCYLGVLAYLLPYIEQGSVYNQFQVNWTPYKPSGNPWWTVGVNVSAARTRIKTYQCPSDNLEETFNDPTAFIVVSTRFRQSDGSYIISGFQASAFGASGVGLTNYLAMAGVFGTLQGTSRGLQIQQYRGVFLNVTDTDNNVITLDAVTAADGTSNTILFGESLNSSYGDPRDVGYTWAGGTLDPSFWVIPSNPTERFWGDWSSNHAGGQIVNFAFGDGSVRPIRPTGRNATTGNPNNPLTAPERAFWALSGYGDGDTTQADGVTN
jgi:prepilin-type processing-associated H-X9-DG protein